MAADWIKMRSDLYRDPRVIRMAEILDDTRGDLGRYVNQQCQCDMSVTRNVLRNATVGALVSVWGVFRQRGKKVGDDLVCRYATIAVVDDVADMPGFGSAMAAVGWVVEKTDSVVFPRFFEDYNADPADAKPSSAAERQRRYRDKVKSENSVTRDGDGNVTRDVTVTPRVEKSREEKKEKKQRAPVVPKGDAAEAVIDAYHEMLPKCRRCEVLTPKLRKKIEKISALAVFSMKRHGLEYDPAEFWSAYFGECQSDPWKSGEKRNPNNPSWRQHIGCLIDDERFQDIMDNAIGRMREAGELP